MATLDSIPVPEKGVAGTTIPAAVPGRTEAVLVLPGRGQVKVINEVGARIWALVDGKRPVREIAAVICTEYEVEALQAQADTLEFIIELESKGILRLLDQPPA